METIAPSGSHSFQWKPLLLEESIPFSGCNSFQWKPFLLIDGISFIGSHSFQCFPQGLCFWWKSLPVVEINPFSRSLFFLVEARWKLLLSIETFPFSGSYSVQCFNIFTSRSYQKLSELLINDSVRSTRWRICHVFIFLEKSFRGQRLIQNPVEHLA